MYEIVEALCRKNSITIAQMCREIEMRPTIISELKHGRTRNLSHSNMVKIANYFKVSIDVFSDKTVENILGNDTNEKIFENKKSSPDDELKSVDFALFGEVKELTTEEKEDILAYIKFKKSQRK